MSEYMFDTQFSVQADDGGWLDEEGGQTQPALCISFKGTKDELIEATPNNTRSEYPYEELDIGYRYLPNRSYAEAKGILWLSDRITGDYIFEMSASTATIRQFLDAVDRFAAGRENEPRYRIEFRVDDHQTADFEKSTFLLYQSDGTLLRDRSLLPRSL